MRRLPTSLVMGSVAVMCASGCLASRDAVGDRPQPADERVEVLALSGALPAADAFAVVEAPRVPARGTSTPSDIAVRSEASINAPGRAMLAAQRELPTTRRHLTLAFTGDTLPHRPLVDQAWASGGGAGFDFRPMFARVASIIGSVDLAVCHLETPVAPAGERLSTAPIYGVPVEIVDAISWAGYDRCSTASNHSLDRGIAGIDATVTALAAAGVGESGMARTLDETIAPVVTVSGIAVAHLSYAYGFNGLRLPPGEEWRANVIDPVRIVADALVARERGADVVIVSLHWGTERVSTPTESQRAVAEVITASGAVDLIVGHHAHVLQPIELVNGRWVAFGLGNFLSNMPTGDSWPASSQDGAVITVTIDELADHSLVVRQPVVQPTWVDRDAGWVIRPVLTDLADPTVSDGTRAELARSLARTAEVLGPFLPS